MEKSKYIFLPDFMIVLKEIDNGLKTLNDIHYKVGITYSHIHKMKKDFISLGWIIEKKDGRKKIISVTPLGKTIIDNMNNFFKTLNVNDNNLYSFRRRTKCKVNKQNIELIENKEE